jgi:D-alanine-D-alanine ligase
MRVGITYDLRSDYLAQGYDEQQTAEFDSIETIDALEEALRRLEHAPQRIGNLHHLTQQLVTGARWDLVFNIAEGMYGYGREAQIPALLDAHQIPYTFSDPLVLSLALHKGMSKRLVSSFGIPTPEFTTVQDETDLATVRLPWPVIAKPVAGGTSAGISGACIANNAEQLEVVCLNLLAQFQQPVLIERFLPGREFTVGMIGTGRRARALGAMEILLLGEAEPALYSFENKRCYTTRVSYRLVTDEMADQLTSLALRVWNGMGCRDAGRIDFRCDDSGAPNFLEINPLAGLHPVDSDLVILGRFLGISHCDLIAMIVDSALQRLSPHARKGNA